MIRTALKKILSNKRCNVCQSKSYSFLPISKEYVSNLNSKDFRVSIRDFETFNFSQYTCPKCGANDRDRLIVLYFQKIFKNTAMKILELAPSVAVRRYFKNFPSIVYRTADLFMKDVDDQVDIQNMHAYSDDMFDIIICSHVLEHIPNDLKALIELKRVLKPGGQCLLLVPIPLSEVGYDEELSDISVDERVRRFGQNDHLRLYTKEIFQKRILESDLELKFFSIKDSNVKEFLRFGISQSSILYIGVKK